MSESDDEIQLPKGLASEELTDTFFDVLKERYPSAEKIKQLVERSGVDSVHGKIIALSAMRDAIKEVSPRLYRSQQHRDELFLAIIEALEDLEDELDELEAEEDEDEDEDD